MWYFFFFKQKTAYEMRISDWSSDVCSSDLSVSLPCVLWARTCTSCGGASVPARPLMSKRSSPDKCSESAVSPSLNCRGSTPMRSEEHTSELQSLMRISYAVFCLKKKK